MGGGRRGSHARRPVPSGRQSRHEGRGPALRRLVRRPAAAAMLCCGLLAVGGGTGGILLLTGHGVISPRPVAHPGPRPAGAVVAPPRPIGPARGARPVYLSIPVIGVRTRLIKLGLTTPGTLQVPASTSVAGWYTGGPRPGVFFRLRLLRPGDCVDVRQARGALAVFRVYAEHSYPKDHFPTQRVYGPAPDPELRLITCGGTFDPAIGSYLNNVVVYAAQVR